MPSPPRFKKAESEKPKTEGWDLNWETKEKLQNGKSVVNQNKKEDLGVIISLFDCIFWVSNQKVVIQKYLDSSLQKRTNKCIAPGYGFADHYLVYYLLFGSASQPTDSEVVIIKEEVILS